MFRARLEVTPAPASAAPAKEMVAPKDLILAKDIRRTIAIFIDDLSLSSESIHFMRPALRKFVDEQIRTGDIVAIYRSSGGLGLFQQFTTDKRALLASVDGVRFRNINGVDSLAVIQNNPAEDDPDPTIAQAAIEQRQIEETMSAMRQDMLTANVLSSAAFIVQGLRELPGRKSMVMFSESLQLQDLPQSLTIAGARASLPGAQGGSRQRAVQSMRSLIDIANRSGVTFYTIDPRGLQVLGLTAMDTPSNMPGRMQGQQLQREMGFALSQGGMAELAEATGGLFFGNNNNLARALESAANDLDGYYLIAFQARLRYLCQIQTGPRKNARVGNQSPQAGLEGSVPPQFRRGHRRGTSPAGQSSHLRNDQPVAIHRYPGQTYAALHRR